jgi:hypothetical protein
MTSYNINTILLTLVAEEAARNIELFAADNDNLLSVEGLLSNNRSETTEKVTLAVDDNDLFQSNRDNNNKKSGENGG